MFGFDPDGPGSTPGGRVMKYTLIKEQGRLAFYDEDNTLHIITARGDYNPDTMQSRQRCYDNVTGKEVEFSIDGSEWRVWYVPV